MLVSHLWRGRKGYSSFLLNPTTLPPMHLLPGGGRRGKDILGLPFPFVVVLFCLLVFCRGGEAIVTKSESVIVMSNQVTEIVKFGFDRTGTMIAEVQHIMDGNSLQLGFFLCTQEQKKQLFAIPDMNSTFCKLGEQKKYSTKYSYNFLPWEPDKNICELNMINPYDDTLASYSVQRYDLYYLSIISCTESSSSLDRVFINYKLINPGGNHLSTADWALPEMYSYCFLGWVWVMCVIVLSMGGHALERSYLTHPEHGNSDLAWMIESQTNSRFMHFALFVAASTKAGVVLMNAILWNMLKSTGERVSWVLMIKNALFSVSECIIFAWILLVGLGWCIVVREVDPDEIQTLSSSLVVLALSLLFFSMYNSSEDMMSLVVMYVFMLPNIFSNIHNNVDGLRLHLTWLRGLLGGVGRGDITEDDGRALEWMAHALTAKIKFYRSLKALLTGFLVSILAVNVSTIFLPWWGEWFSSLGYECLLLGFVFWLFWTVWPPRWRDGLFWFQGEEGDAEAIYDWTDFGRRFLGLGGGAWDNRPRNPSCEEFMERIQDFDRNVSQKAALVQFPVVCQEEKEKEEEQKIDTKESGNREEEDIIEERENDLEDETSNELAMNLFPSDIPTISPSPPNTPTCPLLTSSPKEREGGTMSSQQQLADVDEFTTPRNVYLALPSSVSYHLERGEVEGEGGDVGVGGIGGNPIESNAVVLASFLREVGLY